MRAAKLDERRSAVSRRRYADGGTQLLLARLGGKKAHRAVGKGDLNLGAVSDVLIEG
jgi:hypothetical protein